MSRRAILSLSRTTQRLRVGAPAVMVLATCVTAHAAAPGGPWPAAGGDVSDAVMQQSQPHASSLESARRQIARYCTYLIFAADHLRTAEAPPLTDACRLQLSSQPRAEHAPGLPSLHQPRRSNRQSHAP